MIRIPRPFGTSKRSSEVASGIFSGSNLDPEAFVIINDTYDVLGRGFKTRLIT